MQDREDLEQPSPSPPTNDAGGKSGEKKALRLPMGRRGVAVTVGAVVIAVVLIARTAGIINALPPSSSAAVRDPQGTVPSRAAAQRAPVPTQTPAPTPTPDPDVRPLSGPVAPRVVDRGPAPVRKPGVQDPNPSTDHVIVVDGASGAVLFQRNGYEPIAPASLTKIMTAIVALEHGNLSDQVKITVDARQMPGDSLMGLQPGFDVTFKDLMYGLLLPSGDDAALAIADYVAGSPEKFAELMNQKAQWLGLQDTHFVNPHGLDAPDHYSSPADMVTMARYAMQYPEFRQIVRTKSYDIAESNISYTIFNVNPILGEYSGLDGVKTGYTDNAGRSLVATAVRDGHRIYVAFMHSSDGAMADGTLLLDWAFDSFVWPDAGTSHAGAIIQGAPQ